MAFLPLATPTDMAVTTTAAWVDVDVSALPGYSSAVVGVELLFVITGSSNRQFGCRKNGSTDARTGVLLGFPGGTSTGARIGVDSAGLLEVFIADVDTDVYVTGFYTSHTVFFTNAVDKSQPTINTWTSTDVSTDTGSDTAVVGLFEGQAGAARTMALRATGSTDDRRVATITHTFQMVKLDGSETCEQYIGNADADWVLSGYLTGDAVFTTNATDRSTGTGGSYQTITALPADAVAGVYDLYTTSGVPVLHALRPSGATWDIYRAPYSRSNQAVKCSAPGGVVEQKIAGVDADLYELGYLTAGGNPWNIYAQQLGGLL